MQNVNNNIIDLYELKEACIHEEIQSLKYMRSSISKSIGMYEDRECPDLEHLHNQIQNCYEQLEELNFKPDLIF